MGGEAQTAGPCIELVRGQFEELTDQTLGKIDLVFADPPDNLGLGYDGYGDNLSESVYRKLLSEWLVKCCAITSGPVMFTFNEKWIGCVERAIEDHGLYLHRRCQWYFTFGQSCTKNYAPSLRPVYWLNSPIVYPDAIKVPSARQTKYNDKRAKSGGKMPDSLWQFGGIDADDPVWRFSRVCGTFREKRKWHVCQIPETMLHRVISGHSKPGDRVCDPFVGSGTSAYVADELGRDFLGIDQSQSYLDNITAELFLRRQKRLPCAA